MACCGICNEASCCCRHLQTLLSILVGVINFFIFYAALAREATEISDIWSTIYLWVEVGGIILVNFLYIVMHIMEVHHQSHRRLGDEENQVASTSARLEDSATTSMHSSGSNVGGVHGADFGLGGTSEYNPLLLGNFRSDHGPSGTAISEPPTPRLPQVFSVRRSLPVLGTSRPNTVEVPNRRPVQEIELQTLEERREEFSDNV